MDSLVPPKLTLRVAQSNQQPTRKILGKLDHLLVVVPAALNPDDWPTFPAVKQLTRLAGHTRSDAIPRAATRLSNSRDTAVSVTGFDLSQSTFQRLTRARQVVTNVLGDHPGSLGVYAAGFAPADQDKLVETITIAASAAAFELPSYKSKTSRKRRLRQLRIVGMNQRLDLNLAITAQSGNDLARWLTALPPNKLTSASYQALVKELAKQHSCGYQFLDEKKLAKLGAGAFLAVSQGNRTRDAGIIKLRYRPTGTAAPGRPIALVGKGILFDTGGTNLKPFKSMLEMHTDMGGSAVALGIFLSLAKLEVPYPVDAWLAITENRISADAYKPQDVVTAANGKTIQVIHTDAEGRMVLADTLALAARDKPAVILDYATLTGSCVSALTQRYCGVFSNRPASYQHLIGAGSTCGERVWPFPMDADFDDAIASDIADIKQCAEAGFGDHILAARFLSKFVPDTIPWVHMDLSASNNKGGLGAIPTTITGFGVHFTLRLLEQAGSAAALAAQLEARP